MRIKEINGLVNDILDLQNWKNPLHLFCVENEYQIDLLTGKHNQNEEDSITELLKYKGKWFKQRINDLNANPSDFQKVELTIHLAKEKVEIIYKGKSFEKERFFEHKKYPINEIKKGLKDLENGKGFKVDSKNKELVRD